jgi:hypothetical protein
LSQRHVNKLAPSEPVSQTQTPLKRIDEFALSQEDTEVFCDLMEQMDNWVLDENGNEQPVDVPVERSEKPHSRGPVISMKSICTNLTGAKNFNLRHGLKKAYRCLKLGSFRHMAQSMRAFVPDTTRSIVIGHVIGEQTKNKRLVDNNLAAYSRTLMKSIDDHSRLAVVNIHNK